MSWWPWGQKTEVRESGFGDLVLNALFNQANGASAGSVAELGVVEIAAGFYSRCFASAQVEPRSPTTRFIDPQFLALTARNLLRRGESVHYLEVKNGVVKATPAGSWDIRGGWSEDEWFYRLDLFGPSGNITKFVPSASILHFRYSVDPSRPWFGISPLGWAKSTGNLASYLETRLWQEASGPVGNLLPIPKNPSGQRNADDTDPLDQLRKDITNLKGQSVLVETTAGGWSEGAGMAPKQDWMSKRVGANPPASLAVLRSDAGKTILSACGVPVSLTEGSGSSQGAREAWRQFVFGSVQPLGRIIASELSDKLETNVTLNFSGLQAADLAGRTGSFKKLVEAGVSPSDAFILSSLEELMTNAD